MLYAALIEMFHSVPIDYFNSPAQIRYCLKNINHDFVFGFAGSLLVETDKLALNQI